MQCWILMGNFPGDCVGFLVLSKLQQGALLLCVALVSSYKNKYIIKKRRGWTVWETKRCRFCTVNYCVFLFCLSSRRSIAVYLENNKWEKCYNGAYQLCDASGHGPVWCPLNAWWDTLQLLRELQVRTTQEGLNINHFPTILCTLKPKGIPLHLCQ